MRLLATESICCTFGCDLDSLSCDSASAVPSSGRSVLHLPRPLVKRDSAKFQSQDFAAAEESKSQPLLRLAGRAMLIPSSKHPATPLNTSPALFRPHISTSFHCAQLHRLGTVQRSPLFVLPLQALGEVRKLGMVIRTGGPSSQTVAFRKRAKLSLKSRKGNQASEALKAGASEINKIIDERPNEGGRTAGKRGKRTSQNVSIFKHGWRYNSVQSKFSLRSD